jgi:hypothetical protein
MAGLSNTTQFSRGRRVLCSDGPNHVNLRVCQSGFTTLSLVLLQEQPTVVLLLEDVLQLEPIVFQQREEEGGQRWHQPG